MMVVLESLSGYSLRSPWLLLLIGLVPLAVWYQLGRRASVVFAPAGLVPKLPKTWRLRLLFLPLWMSVAGLCLAALAASRPVKKEARPQTAEGIEILLCLDLSSSMAATDLDRGRTRLQLAKAAAREFIRGRPEDRIGLIAFARFPDMVCPLTLNHEALVRFLERVEMVAPDGPEDLTGIGTAVARAAQVFEQSQAESKVIILLTDGEENVATPNSPAQISPARAAQICQDRGVRVYTIAAGLGSANAEQGNWTPIDTAQVQHLAEKTGGRFYQAREAQTVADVYTKIDELEKTRFEEPRYQLEDQFLPLLVLAILCLVLSRVLEATWLEVVP